MNLWFRSRKKNCLFPSDWVSKKNLTRETAKKFFFAYYFRNIVVLLYSFFYLDSIHYVYLKLFISIETSSWYICSIFKTPDNFFQYILIRRFITIKYDWTKYRMSWVFIRMFLKAVKGGCLNSWNPNTSTELSINLVDSLSLNFLDCRAEMFIHLYEEFFCQYEFQLSLSLSRQNKELEAKSRRFVCFNFIFNINMLHKDGLHVPDKRKYFNLRTLLKA